MDFTLWAIPLFGMLMAAEAVLCRRRGMHRAYRAADVIADLGSGIFSMLVSTAAGGGLVALYLWGASHALVSTPLVPSLASWTAVFVGSELCFYWFHRWTHRAGLGWAVHAPHHSSEDFNFAVALRQGPLQPVASLVFYLPLALLGVPLMMFVTVGSVRAILQFFIHTELVDRLPAPLELILNTPSHHRVHHGCNAGYIDKNYGGVLIVFDRLFGTFAREEARPVYGTITQMTSWNPIVVCVEPVRDLLNKACRAGNLRGGVAALFGPPGYDPARQSEATLDITARVRVVHTPPVPVVRYASAAFALTWLLVLVLVVVGQPRLQPAIWSFGAALATVSLATLGGVLDGRRWALPAEAARWIATAVFIGVAVA